MTTKQAQKIALQRYEKGEKHSVSSAIDEDTIIAGYGEVGYTEFEFPLPDEKVIEIYGTLSWKQHFSNKGFHQYLLTNLKDGRQAMSPYWKEEDLRKNLELNESLGTPFKSEKL